MGCKFWLSVPLSSKKSACFQRALKKTQRAFGDRAFRSPDVYVVAIVVNIQVIVVVMMKWLCGRGCVWQQPPTFPQFSDLTAVHNALLNAIIERLGDQLWKYQLNIIVRRAALEHWSNRYTLVPPAPSLSHWLTIKQGSVPGGCKFMERGRCKKIKHIPILRLGGLQKKER